MTLAAIRARLAAATPGPWMGGSYWQSEVRPTVFEVSVDPGDWIICRGIDRETDADLIAHAPKDLRLLLDVAEAAQNITRQAARQDFDALRNALARLQESA